MVKPTFLCIGVQKAGTTSLINYLSQHPDIYIHPNEIHFFDDTSNIDIEKYENNFNTDKPIVGEKTPAYCYLQYSIDRIYEYNPNMKLILILREPISRLISQYNMNYDNLNIYNLENHINEQEKLKLSDLKQNDLNLLLRGYYDEIIEYILSKFPRNNLYICVAEEVKKDKLNEYNKIIEFLGGKKLTEINNNDTHIRQYNVNVSTELKIKLYNIYKPHIEKLYKILGRRIDIWESMYC